MSAAACSVPAPPDAAGFKALMASMPQAVTVVTTLSPQGEPVGATLSSVMSLSLDPPMMVCAFDRGSATLACLPEGQPFLLHLLAEGQEALAYTFAGKGGAEKFAGTDWSHGPLGMPRLANAAGVVACRVAARHSGGDHVLVTAEISAIDRPDDIHPLLYFRRALHPTRHLRTPA